MTSQEFEPNGRPDFVQKTRFAACAETLKPTLSEWVEHPLRVISFVPDNSNWFGCRASESFTVADLPNMQWGKGDEFILDFGGHRAGYFSFHVEAKGENVDSPARLKLTFGEVPYDVTEEFHPSKSWNSTAWLPDETISIDWFPEDIRLPRRYAFRYVRIQILDTSPKFKILFSDTTSRAVSAISSAIATTVPLLRSSLTHIFARIDEVAQNTLRSCMQDVFEDGPRRDRRLWLGDLRLQALTNYCTFHDYSLVKRCLYLFAAVAGPDGRIPACLFVKPSLKAAGDYIVDYDALFGSVVLDYVIASGDIDTGHDLWESVLGSMKYAISHVSEEGVFVASKSNAWKFLDWSKELDVNAGMHGLTLFCCKAVGKLATVLGKSPPFVDVIEKMTSAASQFYDRQQGVFISGPSHQVSWASQAWMTLSEAFPSDVNKKALITVLNSKSALRFLCPYGYGYFAEALARNDAEEECLSLIRNYWGGMVERGADTFWECYDPKNSRASPYDDCHNNSYCHAWSCSPSYLLRTVLKDYFERPMVRDD